MNFAVGGITDKRKILCRCGDHVKMFCKTRPDKNVNFNSPLNAPRTSEKFYAAGGTT